MAYTDIDNPGLYFNTVLYTGNGQAGNAISGVGFSPDMVWIKERNSTSSNTISDTIRGIKVRFNPDLSQAEETLQNLMTSFDSDGFTNGADNGVNQTNKTYVAWNWLTGTSFTNDASSTSVGSIDSVGSVNTDAGFSIVSYTGTGSAGTIAHGLGATPAMILFKNRPRDTNWLVYDKKNGATKFLYLNVTDAIGDDSGHFNDTEPTSTVFSVGGANGTNYNGEALMAYCFAEKKGYSKLGSYTGNGNADGPFCYTGFKPSFIIGKRTDSAGSWWLLDNKRSGGFNLNDEYLLSDSNQAEADDGSFASDFLANGWKARADNSNFNASGGSYIYMAFAENPFVTSTSVPTTAR